MDEQNLCTQQVEHRVFGAGTVQSVGDGFITIDFPQSSVGKKKFLYPGAFEEYLKMSSPVSQEIVSRDLAVLMERREAARREQELKQAVEAERMRQERLAAAQSRTRKRKTT